jgi:pilus assembly protein CpaE
MLTAALVSSENTSSSILSKCLEQTGMVHQVHVWTGSPQNHPAAGEEMPDVVLLDLPAEPGPYFELAARMQRLRPTIHIVACSQQQQPDPAVLLQAMRSGVRDFLRKPLDVLPLRALLTRFVQDRGSAGPRSTKRLVVMGAKGGVGTTTVAVNLGVQLAQMSRKRVMLIDMAPPLSHVALQLDLHPRFTIRDAAENYERLDSHLLGGLLTRHKSGLEVLAGANNPNEWSLITPAAMTRILDVARDSCDFVLIDVGVYCSPEWAGLLRDSTGILLVAEANVASLWALERQLLALQALDVEPKRARLVINRWHRQDEAALKSVEQRIKHPISLRLPNNYQKVCEALNNGIPLSDNHDNAIVSRLRHFAAEFAGIPVPEKQGALSNLFSLRASR